METASSVSMPRCLAVVELVVGDLARRRLVLDLRLGFATSM
jgi:hypothetical protein